MSAQLQFLVLGAFAEAIALFFLLLVIWVAVKIRSGPTLREDEEIPR